MKADLTLYDLSTDEIHALRGGNWSERLMAGAVGAAFLGGVLAAPVFLVASAGFGASVLAVEAFRGL